MKKLITVLLFVFLVSPAWAEVAVEIVPGVVQHSNRTTSVEIVPGYRQYSGEVRGYSTEIVPGVQTYQLTPEVAPRPALPPSPTELGGRFIETRKTNNRPIP